MSLIANHVSAPKRFLSWVLTLPIAACIVTQASAQPLLNPGTLTKYTDLLPQPPVRRPSGKEGGLPLYEVHIRQAALKMHSQLPRTTSFTFDGAIPGPTFVVPRDHAIKVRYYNDLPQHHLFHVDTMIEVMRGRGYGDQPRFVSQLQGGDVESQYAGWSMSTIAPGQQTTYSYPNSQPGATLWYHDHSLGLTRLNAYAGIAGFYLITDTRENELNLPSGPADIVIAVQDRTFYQDGGLHYPDAWVPEFYGNVALANGVIWPRLEVEPRRYRIRFVNACDDRFLNLKLLRSDAQGNVPAESVPGPEIYLIGTEQGLVNNTVILNDPNDPLSPRLLVGPGDRRDLIIDFRGTGGRSYLMQNNASAPFDGTFPPNPQNPLPELFLIHVKDSCVVDMADIPMHPGNVETPRPDQAYLTRDVLLHEAQDTLADPMMVLLNGKHFRDPITENPVLNTTEIWRYINLTEGMQSMHMDLVGFQILDRTPFDVDRYLATRELVLTGPAESPAPQELGRRDMVSCPSGYVTRVLTSPFKRLGKYVYHSPLLARGENEMMRPFEVVKPSRGGGHLAGETPLNAVLVQNSPEPFQGNTSIAFTLPYQQAVRLTVYNVAGREIVTLASGDLAAGEHRVTWNGSDASGTRVAAGVYYYKLQTPNGTETRRATLYR